MSPAELLRNSGIMDELELVLQRQGRGSVQRYSEILDDPDEVLRCYRRINGHLERFMFNSNLSIWETVDQQTTVSWLNDMAGTSKITIVYNLCAELDSNRKLGASFFCSRMIPECRNVKHILPSVAYQLASFSSPFRYALSQTLKSDRDVHNRLLKNQFEGLIVKPLLEAKHTLDFDIVVVIDALDECENENSVGQILDVLLGNNLSLPIQFLISSRPEPEIYRRMMKRVGANFDARLVLHELDQNAVKNDIKTYLTHELDDIQLIPTQIEALVQRSGILFIYAATASAYIKAGFLLMEHEERLDMILGLSPASEGRTDTFHCNSTKINGLLARACLRMIKHHDPHFNICHLESSYHLGEDISEISGRIDRTISPELFYSCRHWENHVQLAEKPDELADSVHDFLSSRLLLWMEVLNLKRCIHMGVGNMQRIEDWGRRCTYILALHFQDAKHDQTLGNRTVRKTAHPARYLVF
ncbi:hypothetical protein B0J17DRAFT_628069 [Rhizoctonia solani]|nr:hypothetical protein B0J17DRAFT_628069 [Rhizoctonia solani]